MSDFEPFADDTRSTSIGGLTVENGTGRLAIYGSLDITRDRAGLANARALHDLLTRAVATLEADGSLPDKPKRQAGPSTVRNPFAPG